MPSASPPAASQLFLGMAQLRPLSPRDLYDELMARIEPELTTARLPTLVDAYRDETPRQARIRGERYAAAFAAYAAALEQYLLDLAHQALASEHLALGTTERCDRQQEADHLHAIEADIHHT